MINKVSIRRFLNGYFNMHGLIQMLFCLPLDPRINRQISKHTCPVIYNI